MQNEVEFPAKLSKLCWKSIFWLSLAILNSDSIFMQDENSIHSILIIRDRFFLGGVEIT
jgi:hypothetical protein